MSEKKGFLYRLGAGLLLGLGLILPGVSGGVLAMALGLYEPIIAAVANPWTRWRQNITLLLPLGLGAGSCLFLLSSLLEYLFAHYPLLLLYLFLGLVAGGLPTVVGLANKKGFRLSYLVSLPIGVFLVGLVSNLPLLMGGPTFGQSFGGILIQGLLVALGTVIPGLSASFLLMALGTYEGLLAALVHGDPAILLPLALGFLPAAVVVSKVMAYLFKRAYGYTYYAVLGILGASMFVVFPGWPRSEPERAAAFALFLLSLCFSCFLTRGLKGN